MRLNIDGIIGYVAGEAYRMHPYNNPSGVDKIVEHLKLELGKKSDDGYVDVESKNLFSLLRDVLMSCLEFRQLNISKSRWEQGQRDIYDEDNYKSKSKDPVENDFIDLDALIQNVVFGLTIEEEASNDCFLCKYAKEYGSSMPSDCDMCKACTCNPDMGYNREVHPWALLPRNSEEYRRLVDNGEITDMEF